MVVLGVSGVPVHSFLAFLGALGYQDAASKAALSFGGVCGVGSCGAICSVWGGGGGGSFETYWGVESLGRPVSPLRPKPPKWAVSPLKNHPTSPEHPTTPKQNAPAPLSCQSGIEP